MDVSLEIDDRRGQAFGVGFGGAEEVERDPLGRFPSHPGQAGQLGQEGLEEGGTDGAADGLVQRIVDLFDGEILKPGPQGSSAT